MQSIFSLANPCPSITCPHLQTKAQEGPDILSKIGSRPSVLHNNHGRIDGLTGGNGSVGLRRFMRRHTERNGRRGM